METCSIHRLYLSHVDKAPGIPIIFCTKPVLMNTRAHTHTHNTRCFIYPHSSLLFPFFLDIPINLSGGPRLRLRMAAFLIIPRVRRPLLILLSVWIPQSASQAAVPPSGVRHRCGVVCLCVTPSSVYVCVCGSVVAGWGGVRRVGRHEYLLRETGTSIDSK